MHTYDHDFDRVDDGRVDLAVFHWVCRRPFVDPLGLNDAQVVASHQSEALDYLLDKGGWRNRPALSVEIHRSYDVLAEPGALPFDGTWREWTQAVHHGMYSRELVRLPAGALTQEVMDSRVLPPPVVAKPRRRLGDAHVVRFCDRGFDRRNRQNLEPAGRRAASTRPARCKRCPQRPTSYHRTSARS